MQAQILSIGDELLGGYITDTNATWLEQQLALLDIPVDQVTHVGDNLPRLVSIVKRAISEADLVICTGGVGPTEDDLTREAIAAALGEVPAVDPQLLEGIRSFFAGRNLTMPERNAKQAWQIPSSVPLHNPIGTAPGWFVQYGDTAIAAMPGVPREMFLMYQEQLLPRLQSLRAGTVIRSTTLKTIGIGESLAEEKLHDIIRRSDPVIATYAKDDGVHIRVTASADNEASAIANRDACVSEIAARIGETIYGRDAITLPGSLLSQLASKGLTIGITDFGGGGRFAALLASETGSGRQMIGSFMAPSLPPTDQGPADTAAEVAATLATDLGLAIVVTEAEEQPGVFASSISVTIAGRCEANRSFPIRSGHEDIQRRSALLAAEVLRTALLLI